jgi:hypothetical protein
LSIRTPPSDTYVHMEAMEKSQREVRGTEEVRSIARTGMAMGKYAQRLLEDSG